MYSGGGEGSFPLTGDSEPDAQSVTLYIQFMR
jgi:hypothetical protein